MSDHFELPGFLVNHADVKDPEISYTPKDLDASYGPTRSPTSDELKEWANGLIEDLKAVPDDLKGPFIAARYMSLHSKLTKGCV